MNLNISDSNYQAFGKISVYLIVLRHESQYLGFKLSGFWQNQHLPDSFQDLSNINLYSPDIN